MGSWNGHDGEKGGCTKSSPSLLGFPGWQRTPIGFRGGKNPKSVDEGYQSFFSVKVGSVGVCDDRGAA